MAYVVIGPQSSPQYLNAKGGIINIHVTPHLYFGKCIEMFLGLNYNKHLFDSIEIEDGNKYYTEIGPDNLKNGWIVF